MMRIAPAICSMVYNGIGVVLLLFNSGTEQEAATERET
jgi:hypothetical protein